MPSEKAKIDLLCATVMKWYSLALVGVGNAILKRSFIAAYISEKGSASKKTAVQKICIEYLSFQPGDLLPWGRKNSSEL
jgi:hypothetical protein